MPVPTEARESAGAWLASYMHDGQSEEYNDDGEELLEYLEANGLISFPE